MKNLFCIIGLGSYYKYIPYQIYSLLRSNKCDIYILIDHDYIELNESLNYIKAMYPNIQIKIEILPQTDYVQMIAKKQVLAKYLMFTIPLHHFETYDCVYIGDCDMIIDKEDVFSIHWNHCHEIGLNFSNAVRTGTQRLTGLHYFKANELYFSKLKYKFSSYSDAISYLTSNEFKKLNLMDEEFLYTNHDEEDIKILTKYPIFRPWHGFHLGILRSANFMDKLNHLGYRKVLLQTCSSLADDPHFLFIHSLMKELIVDRYLSAYHNLKTHTK
jgi:hypothetical protein